MRRLRVKKKQVMFKGKRQHRSKSKYQTPRRSHSYVKETAKPYAASTRTPTVALARRYGLLTAHQAREAARTWLSSTGFLDALNFGLPEVDDRYHIWRVPLVRKDAPTRRLGEVVIDARTSMVDAERTTKRDILEARLLGKNSGAGQPSSERVLMSSVRNTVMLGDSELMLKDLPAESIGLIFTSPPYYNARPEYEDYLSYEDYLTKIRKIVHHCHRVLGEGRFFAINVSPVLVRRTSRSHASKRIAVPFDFHRLFVEEGYDFIDDIIWEKPAGAGWATGRGRRFSADRNPLQYKPVPVTEYVLVYRKHTEKLIDWNIRNHPDQGVVRRSKIADDYERTNIWKISPTHSSIHPAVFPIELAKKVIRYYSFENDVVLDPFAGIGTTGKAAILLDRRFVLIDNEPKYIDYIRHSMVNWVGQAAKDVLYANCESPEVAGAVLF